MHISTCSFGFGGGKEKEKEREGGGGGGGGREGEKLKEERELVPLSIMLSSSLPCTQVHEGFDPAELGDTIRQLALSVQDTGMFGDLPRPRMMGPRGR